MKETLTFVINPHSVVDIITNSSTEVFVCQRGHSLKVLKEIFESMAKLYHRDSDIFDFDIVTEADWEKDKEYPAGTILVDVEYYAFPFEGIQLLRDIFEVRDTDQQGEW
jgi:hypothetical protein